MDILLDTVTFLWWMEGNRRIPPSIVASLRDTDNRVFLSAVSAWEVTIKHGAGKLTLPASPDQFVAEARRQHGIAPLPITEEEVVQVGKLPRIHGDPFDRLLAAQAIVRGLVLVTPDPMLQMYPCRSRW
jgi:PIN domain nuclease of toxin-antitoxin system